MTDAATIPARPDPAAAWRALLALPAAPKSALSALELDGYLTGVAVAPSPIPPRRWMAGLWTEVESVSDDATQIHHVLSALDAMFNALSARIAQSLRRLETDRICDYRPAFLVEAGQPTHDAVRTWVSGFWRAMALVPAEWSALVNDERMQPIITPFVGFIDLGPDEMFEPAEDIDDRLDEAAAQIPRAVLLLKKIANIRASRPTARHLPHRTKIGRNDPCPCGSGMKFKRCCGHA